MLYIGIDLGTSACKLLLADEAGQVRNAVTKEYPLSFPYPGWSEQEPAHWWAAVLGGVPELLVGFDARSVKGIGIGGQMHGLVALDGADQVLRPAILWNDGRTAKEVDYLNNVVGRENLSKLTANIAFAGFTAPKLLWMRSNEPDLFKKIEKIMLPKDYLVYRLTGIHATDYSDASGMLLLDVEHKCWSKEMCEICGVTEKQLPKLYESWEPVGTLLPEVAKAVGLPECIVATMPQLLWGLVPWVLAAAISAWVPPEPYSSPRTSSAWTLTMPCTPSPTLTAGITSWDVCFLRRAATSGGRMRSSAPRTTRRSRHGSPPRNWAKTMSIFCRTSWASAVPSTTPTPGAASSA